MKKLLVALDGSPRAHGVLAYAVAIARPAGATLVLFRAVHIPADMSLAWPLPDEPLEADLVKRARSYLEDLARGLPAEILAGVRVSVGSPWEAVCKAAREENADLIVIGSHGFGGVDHLLGTTAAKIVNHADRSVLVFRPVTRS